MKIYAAWTSLTVYEEPQMKTNHTCILTFESLYIADNILKAAIVTEVKGKVVGLRNDPVVAQQFAGDVII